MTLLERYIFSRMFRAFLLTLVALSATVWLTQALRQFDLVSAMGQTIVTFFQITLLLLPPLSTVVAPVALLIAVIYTFTSLNDGSELVVINASGAKQKTVLKPTLLLGLMTMVFIAAMTLYLSPLSLQLWRALVTDVRGNVLTSILREGEFITLDNGLIFQLRNRKPDGQLQGIFMSDSREKDTTATYLAERGAVLDSPLGVFLVMNDGTIQRRKRSDESHLDHRVHVLRLRSLDLLQQDRGAGIPAAGARHDLSHPSRPGRPTLPAVSGKIPGGAAFAPDRAAPRPSLRDDPASSSSARPRSTRQRRSATLDAWSLGTAALFGVSSFVLTGLSETNTIALAGMYVVPLAGIAFGIFLVLTGLQPRPPEGVVVIIDAICRGGSPACSAGPPRPRPT